MTDRIDPHTGELVTTHYGWTKPNVAGSPDAWGGYINANYDALDGQLWSIQAAQGNYLPLTGGALTGTLTVQAAVLAANFHIDSAAVAEHNIVSHVAGINRWNLRLGTSEAEAGSNSGSNFYLDAYSDSGTFLSTPLSITRSNGAVQWGGLANFNVGGAIYSSIGYAGKAGNAGVRGSNVFNIYWTGQAQLWIDNVNAGNITVSSDYRIKRDVADLPSMWERVRALKPISYKHQDYLPPGAEKDAAPLIAADDMERWGFIAHELQETLIESAATGVKDQADCIQSPNPWTVIATLTKALQEAMARIEALEAK